MSHRIAFVGFRHYHILDLYEYTKNSLRFDIQAAAEDHAEIAVDLAGRGVTLTHNSITEVFKNPEVYDIVAVGDYYARRGPLALEALK
ncbi:MAG: hypothetical protein HN368_18335, partial [Spirochaetales bacterium]|nr:hypothetical protein [Spirochaetales bacterium]